MRLSSATGAVLAVAALAVGGCGSTGSGQGSRSSRSTGSASPTGSTGAGSSTSSGGSGGAGGAARLGAPNGRVVFAQACEYCHSITGHMKASQQGGDLRDYHVPMAELRQLTAEMPVLHHKLSPAELTAVVDYVAAVERTSR
jgi:mono/diheme cytochrome c family protein